MAEAFKPRLCGSTIFMLLTEASSKGPRGRSARMDGNADPTTEPGMLGSFMRILWPSVNEKNWSPSALSTSTTAFKKGETNRGAWLNLTRLDYFSDGLQHYNENPNGCLLRTKEFFKDCITDNPDELNRLGRRLLELIYLDETISGDEELSIKPNFSIVKKKDITFKMPFMLEPLLLGLLHYIVRKEIKHTEGAETYKEWYGKPDSSNVCHFESNLGTTYFKESTFSLLQDDDTTLKVDDEHLPDSKNSFFGSYDFSEYLTNLKLDKISIKTFLFKEGMYNFEDIYVCSDILVKRNHRIIKEPNAQKIRLESSQYTVISGTGGLGKSMLMNHLLLKAIDSYKEDKLVPVFITLNEIKEGVAYIYDYIFECIKNYAKYLTKDQFYTLMKNGTFLFLFDGLDEIENEKRPNFESQLNDLTRKYSGNVYIISSREREDSTFHTLDKFSVIQLIPFNKEKALEMVDKIDIEDNKLKNEFKKQLDAKLFNEHQDFASNPLLLTIMLLTFEDVGEIQSDTHKFYEDAYRALSRSHDSHKTGYYREYRTKSSGDVLEEYLIEFSALSLLNGTKNFTLTEFQNYFSQVRETIRRTQDSFTCQEFMDDLLYSLCLLQNNNGRYTFVHQSFQEYFCAKRLAKSDTDEMNYLMDYFDDLKNIDFEKNRIFKMIYEMEPIKIRKHVFVPYLKSILESGKTEEDRFLSFLNQTFRQVTYTLNIDVIHEKNIAISFLYSFITETANRLASSRFVSLTGDEYLFEDFVIEVYGWKKIEHSESDKELVPWTNADVYDSFGEKIVSGYIIEIPISHLINDREKYRVLIDALLDNSCDLKEEYNEVQLYLNELIDSITKTGKILKTILSKK